MATKKTNPVSLDRLAQTVKETLLLGGDVLRRGFKKVGKIGYKTPTSPVTRIDLESERKIKSLVHRRFPNHSFLGEESSFSAQRKIQRTPSDPYRWIVDPLDGTVNFIHNIPHSCVSVAVEMNGRVKAGGIFDPFRNELFLAIQGRGSRLNGKSISVSHQRQLNKSLIITGFPYDRDSNYKTYVAMLAPFLKKSGGIRRFGSAAIDMAWVACGRADGFWECKLNPWDVAAGCLLITEAGGKVTDFKSKPLDLLQPRQTMGSNGRIHGQLISIFRSINKYVS